MYRLKIGDLLVVVFVLVFGFITLFAQGKTKKGYTYTVYSRGKEIITAPLARDTTLYISGFFGNTVIRVEKGEVRVISSACKDKLCVKSGAISAAGSSVACVPNGVIVVINGSNDYESITY